MAKADAPQRSRRTDGGTSWIPMVIAVVAIAGFMFWLASQKPSETVVVEEPGADAPAATDSAVQATVVEPATLVQSAAARGLIGQTIEVSSVRVSDTLGAQMFWIEMPDGSPYLVKLDSALVARGTAVPTPDSRVRVIGRVAEKTGAVLDGWTQSGALENPDQRMLAEFGATYIEAQRVEPAGS
jgi:hypothetical protein